MTILGLLFVTGVAFMATMNFEAQRMRYERERSDANPAVGRMMLTMDSVMSDAMIPPAGFSFTGLMLGSTTVYAELPGVHNTFSPIEPYRPDPMSTEYYWPWATDILALRPPDPSKFDGSLFSMIGRPVNYNGQLFPALYPPQIRAASADPIPTNLMTGIWRPGWAQQLGNPPLGILSSVPWDLDALPGPDTVVTPLDADGDGISDSYAVPLAAIPGMDDKQIDELKRVLNPQSEPDGDLSIGLRVIAHGGLVNLSYSHPRLIENVMETGTSAFLPTLQDVLDQGNWPYSPGIEEPQLRRRNFLPPHVPPPGGLLGNTLIKQPDIFAGGGDYPAQLLPYVTQSLGDARYWPFGFDEYNTHPGSPGDSAFTTWSIFMDPEYNLNIPLYETYDRRHLVTSISHEANIRRPVRFVQEDPADATNPPVADDEILNLMHERNLAFFNLPSHNGICPPAMTLLPFELPNYPYNLRNDARIITGLNDTVDYTNYCRCMTDVDANNERSCKLNPRKGQLKLSLSWLEDANGGAFNVNAIPADPRMVRLIYDSFIMMLLNMREPNTAWGMYDDVDDTGTNPKWQWHWKQDGLVELSKTAASLTANLIDYADDDVPGLNGHDLPTEIEIRALDFSPTAAVAPGLGTGMFVYGLEAQPFITEVVANVMDTDGDTNAGPGDYYGIEFFNPYSVTIPLDSYTIVVGAQSYNLNGLILPGSFGGIYGSNPVPGATGNPQQFPMLQFGAISTIKLVRNFNATSGLVSVTVDEFEVTDPLAVVNSTTGEVSHQRSAQVFPNRRRWTAPIPKVYKMGTQTFGAESANSPEYDDTLSGVYLENADAGSFAASFPTTGMMLMLMRYGNKRYTLAGTNEAFTTYLDDEMDVTTGDLPVDNGRMPVFDPFTKHRIAPDMDPTGPAGQSLNRPGDVMHLPWGQFVFDYFTTIPLNNSPGPYTVNPTTMSMNPPNYLAPPKVDMDGLRVHGRININAAPWKVLQGLPFIDLNQILPVQAEMRTAFEDALFPTLPPPVNGVMSIGPKRAKAIVAYREMREYFDPMPPNQTLTGNYDLTRGWAANPITARRGSGFMTIGELANVYHNGPANPSLPAYRLDGNQLAPPGLGGPATPDYTAAIAFLACLQDWATVRSDTFTVYGTLRGVDDQLIEDPTTGMPDTDRQIKDVDSRALRFQETISRVPMFSGAPPSRIGDRVIARYIDARGD